MNLPKLSIKKFNGDVTKWIAFWDSYNSSIHSNPTLSSIDKFNYLVSFVESSAADAITGLTITAANYEEAIATLQKRFGNAQLIIDRHMDALLTMSAVSSHLDIKGLRKLHTTVETHIRGLRALGVSAESYGGLLVSLLVNKLPPEIRLIVTRMSATGTWNLIDVMSILEQEVDARECASASSMLLPPHRPQTRLPTGATLFTNNPASNNEPSCVYCGQRHTSNSCTTITEVGARKDVLRKAGRCYVCLRKNHLSKECRSNQNCRLCRGRHHVTICHRQGASQEGHRSTSKNQPQGITPPASEQPTIMQKRTPTTSNICIDSQTPILLQTAQMLLFNPSSPEQHHTARAVMDSGSQRTYITSRLRYQLNLTTKRREFLRIKTFGATETQDMDCDIVELGVQIEDDETMKFSAIVVPSICNTLTSQPIDYSSQSYDHLSNLELADSAEMTDAIEIDVLIGSDMYWEFVTGEVIRPAECGPTVIRT